MSFNSKNKYENITIICRDYRDLPVYTEADGKTNEEEVGG